ncbi:MAG: ScyD/ScyE family protein [Cryobacterium sp.]
MKTRTFVAAACAAALASVALAAPASAGSNFSFGKFRTIATGLQGPLSLAVANDGTSYVSQNFAGTLERVTRSGERTTVATAPAPGLEIGAVSTRRGEVYFAQGSQPTAEFALMKLGPNGTSTQLADLGEWEATENPDQVNTYGFVDLPEECAAQFPPPPTGPPGPDTPPPPTYTGVVDTHVYASTATRNEIYVADAGGNDILRVGLDGAVSTVAVLPPTAPVTATADLVAQFGFPECAVGLDYVFEPVPTDVEIGPKGWLYVTSLPGGPEDPSLGARGSVVKVNPRTGEVVTVATGFVGATGLAIDDRTGTIAVAEMFGGASGTGQVSVVPPFASTAIASFPVVSPAAIELRNGSVYLTHNAAVFGPEGPEPGNLSVVDLSWRGHHRMHTWDD